MKRWTTFFVIPIIVLLITSCEKKSDFEPIFDDGFQYLIIGHFYGFCQGEECIELFKFELTLMEEIKVFEDTNDNYPNQSDFYEGSFVELSDQYAGLIDDIILSMPESMLQYANQVIGCPDCIDQGGIYIELSKDLSGRTYWIFDQNKSAIPTRFHDLIDVINQTITTIND